jgi:CHAD domain-containing protein
MPAELTAPDGIALEAAAGALAGTLSVHEHPPRRHEQTIYDTFDGRLRAAGLVLVHERGELVLSDRESERERARQRIRRPARPLHLAELAPGPLRAALAPVVEMRALLVRARLDRRVRVLDVLDGERKTVVRLSLSAPAVLGGDGAVTLLPARLRASALRGYEDELAQVCERLEGELGWSPASQPLLDEAIHRAGLDPAGASTRVAVALTPEMAGAQAVAAVLGRLREVAELNLHGTLEDIDTEFLHDLRVAVRRSRAVTRELRGVFDPEALAHLRTELRWLQQVTSSLRDLDVQLLDWEGYLALVEPTLAGALAPVHDEIAARRRQALALTRRALRSERAAALFAAWDRTGGGPDDQVAIADLAGVRIAKLYRRMVRWGRAITDDSPAEELHELRKQGKELRYLLELFGGLYPAEAVRPLVRTLKRLQDVLGRHQDRSVQVELLRSLAPEVAGRPGGTDALVAMGALCQRLLDDEHAARRQFAEVFAPFAERATRRLVEDALR